eukprot:1872849-Pyramimonas_sp.AAC.1
MRKALGNIAARGQRTREVQLTRDRPRMDTLTDVLGTRLICTARTIPGVFESRPRTHKHANMKQSRRHLEGFPLRQAKLEIFPGSRL